MVSDLKALRGTRTMQERHWIDPIPIQYMTTSTLFGNRVDNFYLVGRGKPLAGKVRDMTIEHGNQRRCNSTEDGQSRGMG